VTQQFEITGVQVTFVTLMFCVLCFTV